MSFMSDVLEGRLKPSFKSEPVPQKNDGPVKKIGWVDFFVEEVSKEGVDVLVKVYAPWCAQLRRLPRPTSCWAARWAGSPAWWWRRSTAPPTTCRRTSTSRLTLTSSGSRRPTSPTRGKGRRSPVPWAGNPGARSRSCWPLCGARRPPAARRCARPPPSSSTRWPRRRPRWRSRPSGLAALGPAQQGPRGI
ncbi:unnamed protein product [Heterosigma akashiwo]